MMRVKEYRFKRGSRLAPKHAKAAGRALAAIHRRDGGLSAEAVVTEATAKGNPLHQFFEWNNGRAAQQYRLEQARHLVRGVTVLYENVGGKGPLETRAFVHLQSEAEDEAPYRAIFELMSDEYARSRVLAQALREAELWQKRYEHYSELAGVFIAIEHAKLKLRRAKKRSA